MNIKLEGKEIKEILDRGKTVEQQFSILRMNFEQYRRAYMMDWQEKPKNSEIDRNDWKITPSPSARNEVIGQKRLLDTSELHVEVQEGEQTSRNNDKIERGLKRIVESSGDGRRARVISDATLAASLYGPVILTADFYKDILTAGGLPEWKKRHVEKQERKAPAVVHVLNAEECSFELDDGLILTFHRKYKLRGMQVKSRWGELPSKPLKDNQEYIVLDIYTPENRVIEVEGYGTVMAAPHGLNCLPIGIGFSGGTELFYKPEETINSFLYGKTKAQLWEWETSLLTAIRTNMNMRGLLGPMFHVEGTDEISITHAGGARIMRSDGKATPIDDAIIDPVVFRIMEQINQMNGETTIFGQTLGKNINQDTFSGLAMLSSAGKLPLIDPQRGMEQAFGNIFDYILYRIKEDGLDHPVLSASDVPDQYELKVEFKPDLPQDTLRNATIASQLGGLVSQEWTHTNLLGISDSNAMKKQIAKETIRDAALQALVQDQNFMQTILSQVMPKPAGGGAPSGAPVPPEGMEEMPTERPGQMPNMPGQPDMMEAMPQTDAMIPQAERM